MNKLREQIQKLDAAMIATPEFMIETPEFKKTSKDLEKRVAAFKKLELPAMMIKRTIDLVLGSLNHDRYTRDYSNAVEFVLSAIPDIEKYIADLKKRINEFKRIPEVTLEDYKKAVEDLRKQSSEHTRR